MTQVSIETEDLRRLFEHAASLRQLPNMNANLISKTFLQKSEIIKEILITGGNLMRIISDGVFINKPKKKSYANAGRRKQTYFTKSQ